MLAIITPVGTAVAAPPMKFGDEVVLGEYFETRSGACQGMARPTVVITQRPRLGEIIVQGGQAVRDAGAKCGRLTTGTNKVIYRAGPKSGEDEFAWEVHFQQAARGVMRLTGAQTLIGR